MIDPKAFVNALTESDIRFVTGVPDSLLKSVCACITTHLPPQRHVIAANEGSAIGLAIGHYLATGRPALVYLQNAGLGNVINPVTSLADPEVYGIPMLLMIGWRGEVLSDGTQVHDEPQHRKQGGITPAQLDILGLPYKVIDHQTRDIENVIADLTRVALSRSSPVALVVRKKTFEPFTFTIVDSEPDRMSRETAIRTVVRALPDDVPIVSTTGMASRELFELRKVSGSGHHRDFLSVGGMGHAAQIAMGIARHISPRKVVCLDGDGAFFMHMGGLTNSAECDNLLHIVLNNGAHDSVGGQPTKGRDLHLTAIARACGYRSVALANVEQEIRSRLGSFLLAPHSCFMEIRCRPGARSDLGRPDRAPWEYKTDFMNFLKAPNGRQS